MLKIEHQGIIKLASFATLAEITETSEAKMRSFVNRHGIETFSSSKGGEKLVNVESALRAYYATK